MSTPLGYFGRFLPQRTQRGLGLRPSAATKKLKRGSCESGELFFAFAFLFVASFSGEGGEKRTTAKNKRPKVPF
jgi:hypothetical protein